MCARVLLARISCTRARITRSVCGASPQTPASTQLEFSSHRCTQPLVPATSRAVGSWRDVPTRRVLRSRAVVRKNEPLGDVGSGETSRGDEPGRCAGETCRTCRGRRAGETSRGDVPRGACVHVCEPERKRVCVTSAYGVC